MASLTLPANPGPPGTPCTLMEPVEVPPGGNCMIPGTYRLKLGAETVREKVVVTVCAPHVPLMVTVLVPTAAVLSDQRLRAAFWLVGFTETAAPTPAGKPLIESFTLPVKP